jgi:hypothetical protein
MMEDPTTELGSVESILRPSKNDFLVSLNNLVTGRGKGRRGVNEQGFAWSIKGIV